MGEVFDPYYKWLGIPPAEQPPNHYRLLGVTLFETDPDVIGNAADQRMAHVRTFQAGRHSDLSQRILNEIATARVCLLNAEKKADYDRALQQSAAAWRPRPDMQSVAPGYPPAPPLAPLGESAPAASVPLFTPPESPLPPVPASPASGPPPIAWVDDSLPRYRTRRPKIAWHGPALFVGVLAACALALWLAWQRSVSEDRQRSASEGQAAAPAAAETPEAAPGAEKSVPEADSSHSPRPPRPKSGKKEPPAKRPGPRDLAARVSPSVSSSPPTHPAGKAASPVPRKAAESPMPAAALPPATTATAALPPAATGTATLPPAATGTKPARPAAPAGKQAVPDEAARKAAEAKLATILSGGSALTLRRAAQNINRGPAERFLCWTKAVDLAVAEGDVSAAMKLIDEKAQQFEIEAAVEKAHVLTVLRRAARSPDSFGALAREVLTLVDQPGDRLPRQRLLQLAEMAVGAARKSGDSELNKRAALQYLKLRESPE